jgi:hypothetical protein
MGRCGEELVAAMRAASIDPHGPCALNGLRFRAKSWRSHGAAQ